MTGGRNRLNRKKLPSSKWMAVHPLNREKHFMVRDWVRDEDGEPTDELELEAILTGRILRLHWRELGDPDVWRIGWA